MHFSDRKHILRLAAQQEEIKRIFDRFAREAGAQLEKWTPKAAPGTILPPDVWLHNRVAEKRIEKLLNQLHADLTANIDANTRAAWEAANKKADQMIADFIAGIPLSDTARRGMFASNAGALRAFMQRKHAGMNLSDRIWSVVEGARENMEFYLASGVAEGRPAALLSQDIRYILKEPDKRFRRVRNADGKLVMSQPMKDYHPGRGVYRSSYMNALRVGATETNIAYHEADHQRWQALDFVLGVKVERSRTSALPCPVCDAMQGTYPKGFKFLPWHPFCICHATPVMLSGQEFTDYLVTGRMPDGRVLRDMPASALAYVESHPSYRTSYSYLHNVPFFDKEAAENTSEGGAPAKPARPEKTAWQKADIQRRWNSRKEYNAYSVDMARLLFDHKTGGYVVAHPARLAHGSISKNEGEKLAKELRMAETFARNGYRIEMLEEKPGVPSPDVLINGIKGDLKSTGSANNIVKHAKKAFKKQGAEVVLFEFEEETKELHAELMRLKKKGFRVFYSFKKAGHVFEL